jgi:hypothetical protein
VEKETPDALEVAEKEDEKRTAQEKAGLKTIS